MKCPRCGNEQVIVTPITTTNTKGKTKGFGAFKACLGFLLFNIPGILCGLCGMGKGKTKTTTKTRMIKVCQNCGNQF